jgi:hypothetical protein
VVAEGVLLTKVPATQVNHGVHATALTVVLNCPLSHDVQERSMTQLPSEATQVPGRQDVFATHGVAALPS